MALLSSASPAAAACCSGSSPIWCAAASGARSSRSAIIRSRPRRWASTPRSIKTTTFGVSALYAGVAGGLERHRRSASSRPTVSGCPVARVPRRHRRRRPRLDLGRHVRRALHRIRAQLRRSALGLFRRERQGAARGDLWRFADRDHVRWRRRAPSGRRARWRMAFSACRDASDESLDRREVGSDRRARRRRCRA